MVIADRGSLYANKFIIFETNGICCHDLFLAKFLSNSSTKPKRAVATMVNHQLTLNLSQISATFIHSLILLYSVSVASQCAIDTL